MGSEEFMEFSVAGFSEVGYKWNIEVGMKGEV